MPLLHLDIIQSYIASTTYYQQLIFVRTSLTEIYLPVWTILFLISELNSNVSTFASVLVESNYLLLYILSGSGTLRFDLEPENIGYHSLCIWRNA